MVRKLVSFCCWALVLASLAAAGAPTRAADHVDGSHSFVDGRLDLTDLWVFESPERANHTVLVMAVNWFAGVLNPTTFHPRALYEFAVDNNGDANTDLRFRVLFSEPNEAGVQRMVVSGPQVAGVGSTGQTVNLSGRAGGRAYAGLFDDPHFFDLIGGQTMNFCNPGVDFLAGTNVTAIVLEVPNRVFGSGSIGVWARTIEPLLSTGLLIESGDFGTLQRARHPDQVDRAAIPLVNPAFIPADTKDLYNRGDPAHDVEDFTDDVIRAALERGRSPADAAATADAVLPDILRYRLGAKAVFPENGRALPDDVIDPMLVLLTGFPGASDCVPENDVPFPSSFPYLAPPH